MEFGNLGNYAIIEPLVRELYRVFPNAQIRTTFQMSDEFCERERVTRLPLMLYYEWQRSDIWRGLYEVASSFGRRVLRISLKPTAYIEEVMSADLVLDFSGDLWGENARALGPNRFLVGVCKNLTAQLLGKPVVLLAGSPGPFKRWWHRTLARFVLPRFTLITNREPLSTDLLQSYGISIANTKSTACPAFLFEAQSNDVMRQIYEKERIVDPERPTVGFIVCGWNMPVGPFNRWPRDDSEYFVFVETIEYIVGELGARVCLLAHNNGFVPPPNFTITPGRDHQIVQQLMGILARSNVAGNVFALNGIYTAAETKAIIGRFDMLVSGRVHGAIAGLTQCVPTVIVDYGHEPKAHKLRGFAKLAQTTEYVADPSSLQDMVEKVCKCWAGREEIRRHLNCRIPEVQKLAQQNFDILPLLLAKEK
jgi:colanic acid/amylovoran biosynthesis protein